MKHHLIVGLGNPGSKYEKTRHNIGWLVLDAFLESKGLSWTTDKKSIYAKFSHESHTFHFAKPQEFMNLSGKETSRLIKMYKIPLSSLLVVHDEIDFPYGKIKNKMGGGTAGHNGLNDIVERCGDKSFHRIRIGVGKPTHPSFAVADYVLQKFSEEEFQKMPELIQSAVQKINEWIDLKSKEQPGE